MKKIPSLISRMLKTSSFWQDNYLLLREFKRFKRTALLALCFTLLAAIFEGFGVGFLLSFLQSLTQPDAAAVQTGINWVDVWILGVDQPANERVYRISVVILLTTIIRTGFLYLGTVYSGHAQAYLTYHLRSRLFEQLQALRLGFFSQTRSGFLVNTMTSEITQLKQAVSVMNTLVARLARLIVYVVSMLLLSWQLTLISVMLFLLMTVGITTLLKKVREVSFAITKANGWYTAVALEFINGIRTVQASVAQSYEQQRFDKASVRLRRADKSSAVYSASIEPVTEAASTTVLIGILLFAFTFLIPSGQLKMGSLLTFLFILFRFIPLARFLNGARAKLNNFQGSIDNIKQLLKTEDKPYLTNGRLKFAGLKQNITFEQVSFAYDSGDLILQDINLVIRKGQVTALVGSSGAGKSTLADLIPRFYDPIAGRILFDGQPLNSFDIGSVRRKMAVVSQDTFIFNTSVRDNIAYGLTGVPDADILEAAKLANAWEFIRDLPAGLDTELGDRGTRLSGGQRQRIAIARALLRNPDILILDEATSALDSVSEKLIQQSLEKLAIGRTVITIAHRLSTIAKADMVVVLEQGKIVEQGSYQGLLEQRGKLWKYHKMQYEMQQAS